MKRKGILQFIKNCLEISNYNKRFSSNARLKALIINVLKTMLVHYELTDIEKQSNHRQRFLLLYIDKNNMTFQQLSEATFVGFDTFKDYIKLYNNTALQFIKKRSLTNKSYALLLKEYSSSGL